MTYIDPNENAYQTYGMRRDSFDNIDDDEVNVHDQDQDTLEDIDDREIELKTTQRNPLLFSDGSNSKEQPSPLEAKPREQQRQNNNLNNLVTKVPQSEEDVVNQQDLHKQHFVQTVQALQFIQNNIRVVDDEEMQHMVIDLPPPRFPDRRKYFLRLIM